jgi:hypothetical protein
MRTSRWDSDPTGAGRVVVVIGGIRRGDGVGHHRAP